MSKKKEPILCLFIVAVMIFSTSMVVLAAPIDETRFNNTFTATSTASVSDNGKLTINNQYQGIKGTTTMGEITTYIEKNFLGLFWIRVDIDQPNNQWLDIVYDYLYYGSHTFQLSSHGTYRVTVTYVISGSGGVPDTITKTITKTY